ncbi:rubrerythrin family protein [Candidatus Sumerlaeota bacterium]|nr:rubrerythrin family protein [Candidatus Sumerlaeota bacterium]
MRKMTESNLRTAFAGESQAHMKYLIFAQKAEAEGYPNIARLFRAIAYAEQVHATNHFKALGELGGTLENLGSAIEGETYEVEEMYPAFDAVARLQQEKEAQRSIHFALEAEKIHSAMYHQATQSVDAGKDAEIGQIFICSVCGYTGEGEPPERCPVCGAPSDKFKTF